MQTIEWHKECFKNQTDSLKNQKKLIENMMKQHMKSCDEAKVYGEQIIKAEHEGKVTFDNEKYNIKRGKK